METLKKFKDERAIKLSELKEIAEKMDSATEQEIAKFDNLEKEIEGLDSQIKRLEKAQSLNIQTAQKNHMTPEKKAAKSYSIVKAIREGINGSLTGLEKEMSDEATREASQSGLNTAGAVQIPSFLVNTSQKAVTVAGEGTDLVPTDLSNEIIPVLRPMLQTRALGAQVLSGLTGNVDLPRGTADSVATWEGENDANAESDPTFNKLSLTPNRLGAFTTVSKQLIVQSSPDIEAYVRRSLEFAIAKGIDLAAINGSGSGNQPTGILNTAGIGSVALGTNGGVPTFGSIVDLESQVAADNADFGALNYLLDPQMRGLLKQTVKESGQASYVFESDNTMNGYNAAVSTQIPNNLVKGTSSDCRAIIFGNWNELIIGQWAGVDLVVDQYSLAKNAQIQLIVNTWWDIKLRHAESFAAIKDGLLVAP